MRQNTLSFPILSHVKDRGGKALGLRFICPTLVEHYKQLKNELPMFNDDRAGR
ncbi:hypothetical protein [Bradyrhizobium sp. STM 3562]|uniref:hypothetical protein n=1 Tax=Bradyrhizobium sp. STM 3562 TaxID=578924 RepID=UPI00388FDC18